MWVFGRATCQQSWTNQKSRQFGEYDRGLPTHVYRVAVDLQHIVDGNSAKLATKAMLSKLAKCWECYQDGLLRDVSSSPA